MSDVIDGALDRSDTGDDTVRRFNYQAYVTAILSLKLLDPESKITEIYCEHLEDILLHHEDKGLSAIQVKTRALDQPHFTATDPQIVHVLKRFLLLARNPAHNLVKFTLYTNHAFLRAEDSQTNLRFLIEVAREKKETRLKGDVNSKVLEKLREFSELANLKSAELTTILKRIELCDAGSGAPRLEDGQSELQQAISGLKGSVTMSQPTETLANNLYLIAISSMAYKESKAWTDYLVGLETHEEIQRRSLLQHKRIQPVDVRTCLESTAKTFERRDEYALILHQSLFPLRSPSHTQPDQFREFDVLQLDINQLEYHHNHVLAERVAALRHQRARFNEIQELRERRHPERAGYAAIAHIPLVWDMGVRVTSGWAPDLFEKCVDSDMWMRLPSAGPEYPRLASDEISIFKDAQSKAAVIRISISDTVTRTQTNAVIPSPACDVHLRVEKPTRFSIASREQLAQYAKLFEETLASLPEHDSIHIFCSAQTSACFEFGRRVNPTMRGRVFVYNFDRRATPNYSWGVNVTREVVDDETIILTSDSTEGL